MKDSKILNDQNIVIFNMNIVLYFQILQKFKKLSDFSLYQLVINENIYWFIRASWYTPPIH